MKTNQLMRHITSAILIGMILFTCMNLVGINREDVYGAAGVKATRITDLKTKVSKGKIVLTWKKTVGYKTEGYQIYRYAKKDSVYRSIGKTAARKYTNKSSLKKGTRYYYKVRGYRTVDKKTVYTKWSQTVSAKAR